MKKSKSHLDEMQEKKLLKIEHNTLTLATVGLIASIFIQQAIWSADSRLITGECIVLLVSSLYMLYACIKNGVWDRKGKEPDMKKNTWISLAVSLAFGIFWAVISYVRYGAWMGSLAVFVVTFFMMFVLLMVVFSVSSVMYKQKSRKLELLADEDEQAD